MIDEKADRTRRRFLGLAASGAALALGACASQDAEAGRPEGGGREAVAREEREHEEREHEEREHEEREGEEGISPAEDLMREHGVLERVLLVYEECAGRLQGPGPAPLEAIGGGAAIVRSFVEDYHERLEEEFLFPRLEQARRETELVHTLLAQHRKGRELTDRIVQAVSAGSAPSASDRTQLAGWLLDFSRMVRPHAAREDTVLFPAFEELLGPAACRELGEQFEEREHELFGPDGFADRVRQVAELERAVGIHDLSRFTPA